MSLSLNYELCRCRLIMNYFCGQTAEHPPAGWSKLLPPGGGREGAFTQFVSSDKSPMGSGRCSR